MSGLCDSSSKLCLDGRPSPKKTTTPPANCTDAVIAMAASEHTMNPGSFPKHCPPKRRDRRRLRLRHQLPPHSASRRTAPLQAAHTPQAPVEPLLREAQPKANTADAGEQRTHRKLSQSPRRHGLRGRVWETRKQCLVPQGQEWLPLRWEAGGCCSRSLQARSTDAFRAHCLEILIFLTHGAMNTRRTKARTQQEHSKNTVMAEAGDESFSLQKSCPDHALPASIFTWT